MVSISEDRALHIMQTYLTDNAHIWYPDQIVSFHNTRLYTQYNERVKSDVAFGQFTVRSLVLGCNIVESDEDVTILFTFNKTSPISAYKKNIAKIIKKVSHMQCTDITKNPGERKCNFQGVTYIDKKIVPVDGELLNYQLQRLRLSKKGKDGFLPVIEDIGAVKEWLVRILKIWLKKEKGILAEWTTDDSSEVKTHAINMYCRLSGVDLDISLEDKPGYIRWKDSSKVLPIRKKVSLTEPEARQIIIDNGFEIPAETIFHSIFTDQNNIVGVHYKRKNEDATSGTVIDESSAPDNQNKISFENDMLVYYLDPVRKRVFSQCQNWYKPPVEVAV